MFLKRCKNLHMHGLYEIIDSNRRCTVASNVKCIHFKIKVTIDCGVCLVLFINQILIKSIKALQQSFRYTTNK